MDKNLQFDPLYPDVLGAIVGGLRVSFDDALQAAVGIFPRSAYLNQPIEVIVILQSMVDQVMDIKVALHLPSKSPDGTPLMLSTPKKMVSLTLSPGEVGVLRMPLVALLPSQPATDVPIQVAIRYRSRPGKTVRPPTRGAPPSALSVSPFKLQVLRDVEWVDHPVAASPENVTVVFDINPKRMPAVQQTLKPTYEALWTQERMREEKRNILASLDEARLLALSFSRISIYEPLLHAIDETYAARGLPLHPGEIHAIAKMLTYTVDDRTRFDPNYKIEDERWFQALCQVIAHDEAAAHWEPGELVSRYLFEAIMYDGVLAAFSLIRSRVKVNLGDRAERIAYADKVMRWLAGQIEPDLIYIYLPLALGGVVINHQVTWPDDDPWYVIDGLREAYRGRVRLIQGDAMEIFDMLDKLLARAEEELRRSRIQR
ncbi:MAG TPA: hypothetical protein VHD90_23135 [Phototrophicaceae bacterium]|nr:hypothetical protein [Phototrophicaceae bacterium]